MKIWILSFLKDKNKEKAANLSSYAHQNSEKQKGKKMLASPVCPHFFTLDSWQSLTALRLLGKHRSGHILQNGGV